MAWVKTAIGDELERGCCWRWLYAPQRLPSFNAMCIPVLAAFKIEIKLNLNFASSCNNLIPLDVPETGLGGRRFLLPMDLRHLLSL